MGLEIVLCLYVIMALLRQRRLADLPHMYDDMIALLRRRRLAENVAYVIM